VPPREERRGGTPLGVTDGQLSLPFPTAKVRCPTCHGGGDVYYLAGRPDVVGGKRVVCPACAGKGRVLVPVQINEQPG
jgi:DnaJ-class molecular chaperone